VKEKMMRLFFWDLLYQGIQTPRNRRERKDDAFIVWGFIVSGYSNTEKRARKKRGFIVSGYSNTEKQARKKRWCICCFGIYCMRVFKNRETGEKEKMVHLLFRVVWIP